MHEPGNVYDQSYRLSSLLVYFSQGTIPKSIYHMFMLIRILDGLGQLYIIPVNGLYMYSATLLNASAKHSKPSNEPTTSNSDIKAQKVC